jgi:hypothetical protein
MKFSTNNFTMQYNTMQLNGIVNTYILTSRNKILGVFSSITEAQTNYTRLYYTSTYPLVDVRLQKHKLNDTTHGIDCTHLLTTSVFPSVYRENKYDEYVDECDNCGGEDCIRNGECCNDNYSY